MDSIVIGKDPYTVEKLFDALQSSPSYGNAVCLKWSDISLGLGMDLPTINSRKAGIHLGTLSHNEFVREVLEKWAAGEGATFGKFCAVLRKNGMGGVVQHLEEKFYTPNSKNENVCSKSSSHSLFISSNKPELIEKTDLNTGFMAIMERDDVLSSSERSKLKSIPNEEQKNTEFYDILRKKTQIEFNKVLNAFQETKQTGVVEIFQKFYT